MEKDNIAPERTGTETITETGTWTYPVVKFPEKDTVIYPFRRCTCEHNSVADDFMKLLALRLPTDIFLAKDVCINTLYRHTPYCFDIALFAKSRHTVRIDIEIDEPYCGDTRSPLHYISCGDNYRDDVVNRHGWTVVRFTEQQVVDHAEACVGYVARIVGSMMPELDIDKKLAADADVPTARRWTSNDSLKMAAARTREKYLQRELTGSSSKTPETASLPLTDDEQKCQAEIKTRARSNQIVSKMNSFADAGLYAQDSCIDFIPDEHVYVCNGRKQLLSVSSLIAYFFEKFDALKQAQRQWERYGTPVETSLEKWYTVGQCASEVGTFVHEQAENYFKTGTFETEYTFEYAGKKKTVSIEREKQHFLSFINDHNIKPYRQEWPIYDEELNIAGTIDLTCKQDDGQLVIYDWKRSRKVVDPNGTPITRGFNGKTSLNGINVPDTAYSHYSLQQNLYRYILQKNYGITVKAMHLVVLCPDFDTYYKVDIPIMDEVIQRIVDICKEKDLGHKLIK